MEINKDHYCTKKLFNNDCHFCKSNLKRRKKKEACYNHKNIVYYF